LKSALWCNIFTVRFCNLLRKGTAMRFLFTIVSFCLFCDLSAFPKSEDAGSEVKDSVIINENKDARIRASNYSVVNTGIQARNSDIKDSTLTNTFTGNVNAGNGSFVNTGIKADGAEIKNSEITVETNANINANNAVVKTGVDISGASNAEIKTSYSGNINASGVTVKAGTVEGEVRNKKITTTVNENIDTNGKGLIIGTVKDGGGKASVYENTKGLDFSKRGNGPAARIGNVDIDGGHVTEVKTTVGTGNVVEGLRTKHMANICSETGGIDASGTKHVYVSAKQKEKAKKTGGAVGNTSTADPRIRKVNTYVE